jgi:hypothetical protein
MRRNYFVTIGHFACITTPSCAALSPGDRVILSACPGGFGRMADENDRPPLARRVPGATQAGPADPERRKPPDLPEEFLQRIQAVVSAAHAQAARDLEAQQQREGQPERSGRSRSSTRTARRGSTQADGSKSPNGLLQSVVPNLWHKREERLSDQDAEFDTAPIPRLTASGTIANPGAPATDAQPTDSAESNGGAGTGQTNGRAPITRQERGRQHKHSSGRTGTQDQRSAAQLRARQEEEQGAQAERERAAAEQRARQEQERAAQERAAQERAAQERAKQERARAAQLERERAAEEQARQQRERHAKREQKRTGRQERAAERVRAGEAKRSARAELAQALQERAREEQERAAQLEQERARQEEEQAAIERIRLEQELEDRQWAAQRRARQEREREEAEARARLQQREETEARAREGQERAAQVGQESTHLEKQRKEAEEREREQAEKRAREERERAAQLEQERAQLEKQRKETEEHARQEAEAHARQEQEHKQAEEHAREEHERAAQLEQERAQLEKQRKETEEHARLEKQRKETEEHAREEQERERTRKRPPAAVETEHPESPDPVAGPAAVPNRVRKPAASPEQAEKPGERKVAATVLTAPGRVTQPGPGKRTALRRYRVPAAIAAAVVLLAAGSLIVAQSLHTSTHKSLTPAQISAAMRNQAAAWVATQVDATAIVSCDPVMCRVLTAHGVPAHDVHELEPSATTPLGSQVVVATAAIRNQFGSRLNSVYAPAVIASFGSGKARIDVRVIAPDGAAAFWSQFRADQRERKTNGTALLTTGSVTTSTPAREQLTTGQVDSRLIVLLSFLAPAFRLDVVAFGDSRSSATAGMPLRSLTLTGGKANLRSILVYVRTHETAPYIPEYTQITRHDGTPELLIEFSAPSPLGVFNPPNS